MHIGWFCAALSALALLSSACAVAATPDPALRRSEQLDARKLGKVSEDERSVLRVEWRAAVTGADEARTVQEMLDSLRHMEVTIAEISRLIRSIPLQKQIVAPVAAEPSESGNHDFRLALANSAAAVLVALWWFRRRKSAKQPAASADLDASAAASLPVMELPGARLPATTPPPEAAPARMPASGLSAEQPKPTHLASAAPTRKEAPRIAPGLAESVPATPQAAAETQAIDFSLEEADPESVARENARVSRLPAKSPQKAARSPPTKNVEPTLELAEIMLSMGLEQGAAQALVEYTEANPRHAVYHWLKLLGIYRSRGLQKEFTETAEKLRKHFNIQAEDWVRTGTTEAPTLEKFSRVSAQLQKIWGQPAECISYLRHLLEDNREGARAGFPQAAAEDILLLIEILKETSGASQAVET